MGDRDHIEPPGRLEQLLYVQALEHPDTAAIEDEQGTLDYQTALLYAQRIAHELLSTVPKQAIQPHDSANVGLCLHKGSSAIVALFGILIAGCCYVPLQIEAGADRLRRVVELARLQTILVDNDTLQPLSDKLHQTEVDNVRPRLLNVQALLASAAGHASPPPLLGRETPTSANNSTAAYTIFSSGTTGVPKGIMMSHSSVLQYLEASKDTFKARRHDRWLHAAPYTFDVSVEEIFVPLAAGACIVCQPRQGLETLTGYLDFLRASRITAVSMPTALWHRLSAHLVDNTEDELPSDLRLVVIGGEAARIDAYRQWLSVTKGRAVELINAYGPTETCVSATFGTSFARDDKILSIGNTLPGMRAYIVERGSNSALVPDGQVGRLLLSGPQLALGYLGDKILTASKFFPNPFAEEASANPPYDRVYDTGDLVMRTPTGELTFCGRVDMQLQVRGQRVEAEGVESVLASCPSVVEASILVTEEQGTEAMVAFLVPHEGHAEEDVLQQAEIRCAADLMPFEKPSHFVMLAKLPLTANGKVDKVALAKAWASQKEKYASLHHRFTPLKTDTEKALADLWSEVLCLERSSIHLGGQSTLVELGGHSLTLVSLTSKIFKYFQLRVTVTELARHQELSEMAAFLDSLPRRSAVERPPPESYTADRHFDLTLPQEQLYLAQSKEPHSPFFNDGVAIEIEGWCDLRRLETAVQKTVQRHEALRCVLVRADNGDKVQQCLLPWSPSLWESMWHLQTVQASDLEGVSTEIFSAPLDLFRGPLVKVHLLQEEGGRRSVLIVQAHHIIWDGFSDGIFLEELAALYRDPDTALETPAPFRAILQSLSMRRDASATGELSAYLRNVPEAVDLPADLAPPPNKSYSRGGVVRFSWDSESVRQAASAIPGKNVTRTSLALAVYATVLRRFAGGQNDFTLGIPMANRTTAEVASTIGFFVNMLPFRLQAEEEHRLVDVLDAVEAGLATLFRNQDVVLADVYRRQEGSGSTHERLLKFCFSFQNAPEGRLSPECTFKRWPLHNGAARAELTCFTELCADGSIAGELEYDADLFERDTMTSMADCMAHTLQEIAWRQAWECPLSHLTLVKSQPEDNIPVIVSENMVQSTINLGIYLLGAIESHAHDVAIVDEVSHCCITYMELAQKAKSLAQRIRINSYSTGNAGPVLLLLRRSWEVPVAQIASALANRPWICCDVDQPRERTTRIISQSKPSCIIAQQKVIDELYVELSECPVPIIYTAEAFDGDSDTHGDSGANEATDNLAYIIYTSGTTGTPKGVAIEQHSFIAFLEHIKSWLTQPGAPSSFSSILTSNTAFDGSLSQIYSALTTGGRLIIAKSGGEQDGEYVAATLDKYAVNYLCTTTAALRLWMTQAAESCPRFFGSHFRYILLGGDELAPKFISQIFSRSRCPAQVEIKNVYGPTEGTIFSSYGTYRLPDLTWLERRRRSPIDTVLPSADISIVGPNLRELPAGAVGEIVIWGTCLAREYIDLPEVNAAKFIIRGGLRGWKTGDLGRKTPSGEFEVLGRLDSMRKILGGFRVDMEETKLAIMGHDRVRECHVSTVEEESDGVKENKLVAHIVLHPSEEQSTLRLSNDLETVANYQTMFTDVNQSLEEYSEEEVDLSFDYRGWASSFDRSTIPKEDMKEWVDCTVARILEQECFKDGNRPRVAEIGCGTGMILFSLAAKVSSYYGADLAAPTADQVQRQARKLGYSHIRTAALPAHDFDNGLDPEEKFDLIICNSVAQYFPSLAYLDNVIRRARTRLAPGGSLFMGDIRHGGLKMQHAATSAFFRGAKTVSELRQSMADILEKDKELQIDPSFFVARCGRPDRLFPGDFRIELRRGMAPTEMTLFRYDAVLMTTTEHDIPPARFQTVDWRHDWVSEPHLLPPVRPGADAEVIVFPELPNKRIQTSDCLKSIADTESKHDDDCQISTLLLRDCRKTQIAWDPEALLSQVQAEGFQGIILPSPSSPASFDFIIAPSSFLAAARSWALTRLASAPVLSPAEQQQNPCQRALMPSVDRRGLFSHLFHKVPRYMIPHYVICVDQLPLAGTGKVDTKQLPRPGPGDVFSGTFASRRQRSADDDKGDGSVSKEVLPLAQKIAAIFTEVLNKSEEDRCSVHDDFFFSGGHSIIAAKAVQVIRKRLGLVVPFTAILAHPTPATLATRLAEIGRFQDQASDVPPPMMLLQPSKTSPPQTDMVVMHPIGGGLLPMAGLVDAIGARFDQIRILGIPWSQEHVGEAQTIDDVAQIYAGILSDFCSRRATSANKLFFVGWSFGGTLVYEACKRLRLTDRAAIQVVLLDAPTVEIAVGNIDPRALAAENYAEQVVEYIASRNATVDTHGKSLSSRQGASHETVQRAFLDHNIDPQTDLRSLPPLVRQSLLVPAWVTDTDLVEALRGLQKNLQVICGSSRQESRESMLIPGNLEVSIFQLQARDGLGVRLASADLGWEAELARQDGKVDWVQHIVDGGHDELLLSPMSRKVVEIIAEKVTI
ncbi:NRPS [Diatrype stigma]|uniref:NRPS n=1 Tax=Diatrype stigma TaxID=117547 RepID=A0AAN9V2A3_9PEZI